MSGSCVCRKKLGLTTANIEMKTKPGGAAEDDLNEHDRRLVPAHFTRQGRLKS